MMESQKEQWIVDTMSSIDRIGRAEVNPFLYTKVMQRRENRSINVIVINPRLAWAVAASLILLIGLNVFVCANFSKTNTAQGKTGTTAFASEYFQFMNNDQF